MNAVLFLALAIAQPEESTRYQRAAAEAFRQKAPLVLFVGHERKLTPSDDWKAVYTSVESLKGYPEKCIVIGKVTDKGELVRSTILATSSEERHIRKVADGIAKLDPAKTDKQRQAEIEATGQAAIFVKTPARKLMFVQPWIMDSWDGDDTPRIVLIVGKNQKQFYPDSTDEGLEVVFRQMQRGGSSLTANPFQPDKKSAVEQSVPARPDDSGPWLPVREQERIKTFWPEKAPFPKGLKFYLLAPRYQELQTTGGGSVWIRNIIHPADLESREFLVSGGLAHIPQSKWISVKGLAVPEGKKIDVWTETTDVRAFSDVGRWRWRFPVGTVAVDALFNEKGEPFEIRTQEKEADRWVTNISFRDKDKAPDNYHGAGKVCASCHSTTGQVMSVPGRIYMRVRWGDDGRFSWRPFKDDNTIDQRWPVNVMGLYRGR